MENLMLVSAANCPSQIESSRWFTIVKWSFLFWKNRKKSPTSQTPYLLVGATEWQQNTWLFPQNSFKANSWRQHPTSTWEHPTVPSPGKIRGREFPKTQRWNTTCQVIELLLSNVRSWGNVDNVEDHMVYPINIYIYTHHTYIVFWQRIPAFWTYIHSPTFTASLYPSSLAFPAATKPTSDILLYWLVHKEPYIGLFQSP